MITYTVEISSAEDAALSTITSSVQQWIDNALHERARLAIEDIVKITVEKCVETNTQIPQTKEGMVELALNRGWVKTTAQQQVEFEAKIKETIVALENQ
jgi:hypothetical protein